MRTHANDLIESSTLAPLQEMYKPLNLSKKDASILASISTTSISAIETTIGTLTHLLNNLKIYKECVIDAINLQAESADLVTKYSQDVPQQSHQLPGIICLPQSYDLDAIRVDNTRMMQIKDSIDKAQQQKDIYLRLSNEDVRLFMGAWKKLNLANSTFDEFIEGLNKQINDSY